MASSNCATPEPARRTGRPWTVFRRLSPAERRLLFGASVRLPLVVAALRLFGYRRVHTALASLPPRPRRAGAPPEAVARIVHRAGRAGPFHLSCLPQSLVLWWMLRERGVRAELRLGARKEDGRLLAHAWVEQEGAPLDEDALVAVRFPLLFPPTLSAGAPETAQWDLHAADSDSLHTGASQAA